MLKIEWFRGSGNSSRVTAFGDISWAPETRDYRVQCPNGTTFIIPRGHTIAVSQVAAEAAVTAEEG